MPAPNTISIDKLVRLLGTPKCPTLIDVRLDDELAAHPYLIPSSRHPLALRSRPLMNRKRLGAAREKRKNRKATWYNHAQICQWNRNPKTG